MNKIAEIQSEINEITRYMSSISPKVSKYAELEQRRKKLHKELDGVAGPEQPVMKRRVGAKQ